MKYIVDINCDMGESFGEYKLGNDENVIRSITSSNIACGFHASDPNIMERTVLLCKQNNVMAGAHPGYPDLKGFGRRFMDMSEADLINNIIYQTGALKGFLDFHNVPLQHIKLHGALYNYMINREDLFFRMAINLRKAFGDIFFITLGTKKTALLKNRFKTEGIKIALEAFPDRSYTDKGELLSRNYDGAVLHDQELIAVRSVKMLKEGGIESITGAWIDMDIDTLCIHGDNKESIEAANKMHEYLLKEGISIKPLSSFL